MSEREWLRAASRLWTAVRLNGTAVADSVTIDSGLAGYNVVLQRMEWQPDGGPESGNRQRQDRGGGTNTSQMRSDQRDYDHRDARHGEREEGAEQLSRPRDRDARDSRHSPPPAADTASDREAARPTPKTEGGAPRRDASKPDASKYNPRDVRYRPPALQEQQMDGEDEEGLLLVPPPPAGPRPVTAEESPPQSQAPQSQEDD
jgi:hypothetical protein